ncbi:MAG: hypothetical protein HRU00_08430 [Myxococcales bacterium]|nr:hypothetical protein [Myxococcales bacterium]
MESRTARRLRQLLLWGAGACLLVLFLPATVAVFVDARGHPYLTDRDRVPVEGAARLTPAELRRRWSGDLLGPPLDLPPDPGGEEGRYRRNLDAARDDLARGDVRHALESLRRLGQDRPGRPEALFLIAKVELERGHYAPAREAIEEILGTASPVADGWREAAAALADEIAAERALSESRPGARSPVRTRSSAHFRVTYDHRFARNDFGAAVLELLERVRSESLDRFGRRLRDPLAVKLYSRAHYLDRYGHRFGFATVGFYDGAIHVVSARHPRLELEALLVHEYLHALFHDALGSHRPFFLNEGIAESEEERVRGRSALSRRDWRELLEALRADGWIPLASLVRGFGGLEGGRSAAAYLESRAAVQLIENRFPGAVARWLERCAEGARWEAAMEAETGWNLEQLERALIADVESRFVPDPLAAAGAQLSGAK